MISFSKLFSMQLQCKLILPLFYHFRERIIWDAYRIRLLPKTLILGIMLENKRSNARSVCG
ncbi:MAG: hypothetical protein RMY34_29465, partial [Aulosira sp. DedQUE10]|nr:hypothetical protein [Aulosira sp. DedQUE10]